MILDQELNKKHLKGKDVNWINAGVCIFESIPVSIDEKSLNIEIEPLLHKIDLALSAIPLKELTNAYQKLKK